MSDLSAMGGEVEQKSLHSSVLGLAQGKRTKKEAILLGPELGVWGKRKQARGRMDRMWNSGCSRDGLHTRDTINWDGGSGVIARVVVVMKGLTSDGV